MMLLKQLLDTTTTTATATATATATTTSSVTLSIVGSTRYKNTSQVVTKQKIKQKAVFDKVLDTPLGSLFPRSLVIALEYSTRFQ